MRPFTVIRKQFISVGSNKGGVITTKIFSIIRTDLINGIDVPKYLAYVLENVDKKNIEDILPYSKNI